MRTHKGIPQANTPWGRLRKIIEGFFADSVRGRVAVHVTQYKTCEFRCGRGWITIDGKEILDASTHGAFAAFEREALRLFEKKGALWINKMYGKFWGERWDTNKVLEYGHFESGGDEILGAYVAAKNALFDSGVFTEPDFTFALRWYADASIEEILAVGNPIVRAIAMLDRRVGKRRLKTFDPEKEHLLVRKLLGFRLEAEGMAEAAKPRGNST